MLAQVGSGQTSHLVAEDEEARLGSCMQMKGCPLVIHPPLAGVQLPKHSLLGSLPGWTRRGQREKAIPEHTLNRCIESLHKENLGLAKAVSSSLS